jgi:hypothetical protein
LTDAECVVRRKTSALTPITEAIEEKLRTQPRAGAGKQRVRLPLVPSAHPGAAQLTAERVAKIMSDNDVSH